MIMLKLLQSIMYTQQVNTLIHVSICLFSLCLQCDQIRLFQLFQKYVCFSQIFAKSIVLAVGTHIATFAINRKTQQRQSIEPSAIPDSHKESHPLSKILGFLLANKFSEEQFVSFLYILNQYIFKDKNMHSGPVHFAH